MGFADRQIRQLKRKLSDRHVRHREIDGTEITYLEGWHVIAEANRIFGFDGWSRETIESSCIWAKQSGQRYGTAYSTKVRITVFAGDRQIIREGQGSGEAFAFMPGEAHERAMKAAETDATKRALMTFGNPFGLSLYAASPAQKAGESLEQSGKGKVSGSQCSGNTSRLNGRSISGAALEKRGLPVKTPSGNGRVQKTSGSMADQQEIKAETTNGSAETDNSSATLEETIEPTGHIDRTAAPYGEPKRERNPAHLRKVAARPCIVCGKNRAQAHHLTYLQPKAMGRKVSDAFTVPLCSTHHRELHGYGNEPAFWKEKGIDPEPVAKNLWCESD
jgi:DNA recombination protein Rad52